MNKWYKQYVYQSKYQRLILRRANKYYYVYDNEIHSQILISPSVVANLYAVESTEDITKYDEYEPLRRFALKLESDLYQELMK